MDLRHIAMEQVLSLCGWNILFSRVQFAAIPHNSDNLSVDSYCFTALKRMGLSNSLCDCIHLNKVVSEMNLAHSVN